MFSVNRFQKLASIIREQSEEETAAPKKRKIFVLVGPPSVGKSTWVANTFAEPPYVIDRDSIVEEVAASYGWTYDDMFVTPPVDAEIGNVDQKYGEVRPAPPWMRWSKTAFSKVLAANAEVQSKFNQKVAGAVSSGKDVVVDMTNMNTSARKQALKAVEGADFEKIAVVFEFQGAENFIKNVAQKRAEAAKRMGKSKTISPAVFDRMFSAFSRPHPGEGFDQIVSVDNRSLLKQLANESMAEGKENMNTSRWQKLAGIIKEQANDIDEDEIDRERERQFKFDVEKQQQQFQKEKEEENEREHPHATFRPGRDEEDERDFLPNTFDWMRELENDRDLGEQIKIDTSPESMQPSREDEEEWLASRGEYTFPERLPPGHEDYGFNAVVINDIGEELLSVTADMAGLRKAEILHKRLGRAIEAMKEEIRETSQIGEAIGSADVVDGPYTKKTDKQPMEECGCNDNEEAVVIEWE